MKIKQPVIESKVPYFQLKEKFQLDCHSCLIQEQILLLTLTCTNYLIFETL